MLLRAPLLSLLPLCLLLAACATPAGLRLAEPSREGLLEGQHGRLARCALRAVEARHRLTVDLREFPDDAQTELLARNVFSELIFVGEFTQAGDGLVRVRIWQRPDVLFVDPAATAWEGAIGCGRN